MGDGLLVLEAMELLRCLRGNGMNILDGRRPDEMTIPFLTYI